MTVISRKAHQSEGAAFRDRNTRNYRFACHLLDESLTGGMMVEHFWPAPSRFIARIVTLYVALKGIEKVIFAYRVLSVIFSGPTMPVRPVAFSLTFSYEIS